MSKNRDGLLNKSIQPVMVRIFSIVFTLCFVNVFYTYSQQEYPESQSIKSPVASDLGRYGSIPVNLFNGLPQINLPLRDLECGDISLPIALGYYSSGIKADQFPGWLGLGWVLEGGGQITRTTNGTIDEFIAVKYKVGDDFSQRFKKLSANNWNTSEFIKSNDVNLEPDEFSFAFNGLTGSFYLSHDGTWKVKSKENHNLNVECVVQENFYYSGITLPRAIVKFTLTTGDGFKYIFGGDASSFELSLPAMQYVPPLLNPTFYDEHNPGLKLQSTAWYLTEIISPKGRHARFFYSEAYFNAQQTNFTQFGSYTQTAINSVSIHGTYMHYLQRIELDNGVNVSFETSQTNQLAWPNATDKNGYPLNFIMYSVDPIPTYRKLDKIVFKYNNNVKANVSFRYIENAAERLKLKEMSIRTSDGLDAYVYGFQYYDLRLPSYNTGKVDHWGFYNGRSGYSDDEMPADNGNTYYQTREPDVSYCSAEMLRKVIYPTNGYTEFFYEPHDYAKYVSHSLAAFSCESIPSDKVAGGVRIRKIVNYD